MPSMSKEKHLFIFEGKAEPNYHESLESNFLGDRFSIKCIFDAEIYQLQLYDFFIFTKTISSLSSGGYNLVLMQFLI